MLETGIPIRSKELVLADVFTYIFSDEWGISPELQINKEMPDLANTRGSVHYQQANEAEKNNPNYLGGGVDNDFPETK